MGGGMAVVVRVQNIYYLINQFLLGEIGKPPSFRTTTLTLLLQWVKAPAQWPMICMWIYTSYIFDSVSPFHLFVGVKCITEVHSECNIK